MRVEHMDNGDMQVTIDEPHVVMKLEIGDETAAVYSCMDVMEQPVGHEHLSRAYGKTLDDDILSSLAFVGIGDDDTQPFTLEWEL